MLVCIVHFQKGFQPKEICADHIQVKEADTEEAIAWHNGYFDTEVQREIIGSMFPEKFSFESLKHRTAPVDDLFQLIYQINSTLWEKKKKGKRP